MAVEMVGEWLESQSDNICLTLTVFVFCYFSHQITFHLITFWVIFRNYTTYVWLIAPRRWAWISIWDATWFHLRTWWCWPEVWMIVMSWKSFGKLWRDLVKEVIKFFVKVFTAPNWNLISCPILLVVWTRPVTIWRIFVWFTARWEMRASNISWSPAIRTLLPLWPF